MKPIIIIGSGLAGYGLAREFRKLDTATPLFIITRDKGDAYSKPMLSAACTSGKTPQSLISATTEKMAQDLNATILQETAVSKIDTNSRLVVTSQGTYEYQSLVLALGAEVIRPRLEGNGVDSVLSVNDLWDYARFREVLESAKRIAILGSGLIGCEFANDLAGKGYDITVIGMTDQPLTPLIPAAAGAALKQRLSDLGVQWRLGRTATAVEQASNGLNVVLDNGDRINADLVLSAVGLRARTALAAEAGIAVNRGIIVDDHLRTSAPDVYALGDCIEINGQLMPYVMPIMHASRALAKTLAGEHTAVAFPAMPVAVKTPACPISVLPAPANAEGAWQLLEEDGGLKFGFVDSEQKLQGFVLTESKTTQRTALVSQLGNPLS
jgi:rubredoxin-NAD+ reductase